MSPRKNKKQKPKNLNAEEQVADDKYAPPTIDEATISNYRIPTHSDLQLRGLINLGNTCYLNSALQSVIGIKELHGHLREICGDSDCPPVSKAFGQLLRNVWEKKGPVQLSPLRVREAVGQLDPMFLSSQQQDSMEFLVVLLDALHVESNKAQKVPYEQITARQGETERDLAERNWNFYKRRNESKIVDLFHCLKVCLVGCGKCQVKCLEKSAFQAISCLNLSVGADSDLNDLLSDFFAKRKSEEGDGSVRKCETCQEELTEVTTLAGCPRYLIVHLNRFKMDMMTGITQKVNFLVRYPERLEIMDFFMKKTVSYSLCAVVNHSGSLQYGHYYAYVRRRHDKEGNLWFEANDSMISELLNTDFKNNPNAYYFVFEREEENNVATNIEAQQSQEKPAEKASNEGVRQAVASVAQLVPADETNKEEEVSPTASAANQRKKNRNQKKRERRKANKEKNQNHPDSRNTEFSDFVDYVQKK